MKKLLYAVTAGMTVIASVAVNCRAEEKGRGPAFNDISLYDVTLHAAQIPVPEPATPGKITATAGESRAKGTYIPAHGYTPRQEKEMADHNAKVRSRSIKAIGPMVSKYRPYADYEKTGYLIMSAAEMSGQTKLDIAKNLPADAVLVLFDDADLSAPDKEAFLKYYGKVVPRERIKFISLPNAHDGFWARDGIPVPVLGPDNSLTVIDAKYYNNFEPDKEISRFFNAGLEKHDYFFEGGNLQANHTGDCLIVNKEKYALIPDKIFTGLYGCKTLTRLPFIDGIGHVDERARFINEKTLVTDTPLYKNILEAKGFSVYMLPRAMNPLETYVNSLIMNDHVVVPVFDEETDAQALAVYEKLGLKASGTNSFDLSNDGGGSIHCITMTYPKVPVAELLKTIGAKELN